MYYILYHSYSAIEFTDEKLKELLIQARDKNKRLGITGLLFYFSGQFLQLIEGDEATVVQLAKEIAADTRHMSFTILRQGEIDDRFFADWSMGFKSIDQNNLKDVESFKELRAGADNISAVVHLLNILSSDTV